MPAYGEELLIRKFVCLFVALFVFEGGNLVLIAPVPGYCLSNT